MFSTLWGWDEIGGAHTVVQVTAAACSVGCSANFRVRMNVLIKT